MHSGTDNHQKNIRVLQRYLWTRVWSVEFSAALITHYPFSCFRNHWQDVRLELELNFTGVSVGTDQCWTHTQAYTFSCHSVSVLGGQGENPVSVVICTG